jgi:hypothetical protein
MNPWVTRTVAAAVSAIPPQQLRQLGEVHRYPPRSSRVGRIGRARLGF